ncbi:MAG: type II toxin-antitoxin system RelE/ParE family toxin [Candidatus Aminicenantes bacterium]|nr:type II toxin-antitoxin system RelE/ParE family toxin [Candidatus Aminicenantes bacterium]
MKLDISKQSVKFIKTLNPKQCRQVVHKIFDLLINPHPNDSAKLAGDPDYKRVDVGEYRVIYKLESGFVKITAVGKRNDDEIYRIFKRKI